MQYINVLFSIKEISQKI